MTKHTADRIVTNKELKQRMIKSSFDDLQRLLAKIGDKKWNAETGKWEERKAQ